MSWLSTLRERFAVSQAPTQEQVLARLLPMWQSARPLPQPNDYRAYANDGYRRNAIIFACTTEISTSAADPPLQAMRVRGAEATPLPDTDPLSVLLSRPNSEQSMREVTQILTTHAHVSGNWYLHKVRARNGQPVQLWPLRPDRVEIKPGSNGLIDAYAYTVGTQTTMIPAVDVIHFKLHPDPLDDFYGLSPISVLSRFGDLDNSAVDFLRAFFLNAGVPGGLLTFKTGRVGKDERERVRSLWRDQFSTVKGWHDVGVMDADVEYQELGSVPKKLDLSTVWGVTESRICSTYGVPPILIGAWIGLQFGTYSNYEQAERSFWMETMSPLFARTSDKLSHGLAVDFGVDRVVQYDLSKVQALQEQRAAKEARALKAWESGLITMNQANTELGYPEAPDGDVRKAPAYSPFAPAATMSRSKRIAPRRERHALPKFVDQAPDDPFYLAVHRIADNLTPAMREAFTKGVLAMQREINEIVLIEAVEAGNMARALSAIPFEGFADSLKVDGGEIVLRVIEESGAAAATTLKATHGMTMTFDLTNPRAQQWAATQTAKLVTEVSESTKEAVRAIIERGFSEHLPPRELSKSIQEIVGLHSRQATAVSNFRARLEATEVAADVIERRVAKYAAAQLRYRGTMIARQETLSASNAGQRELWLQARETDLLPSDQKRGWITTPDGRLCTDLCEPMDGEEVGLDEPWMTVNGPVMIPQQIHPECRCAQGLVRA